MQLRLNALSATLKLVVKCADKEALQYTNSFQIRYVKLAVNMLTSMTAYFQVCNAASKCI